jgi:hypothetical protein
VLVDVASLMVAVAALVVAVVARYLSSLRRADVEVDLVPTSNALSGAASAQMLNVMLFVSNTGIHGGVLRHSSARAGYCHAQLAAERRSREAQASLCPRWSSEHPHPDNRSSSQGGVPL